MHTVRSSHQEVFCEKTALIFFPNFQKNTCGRNLFFSKFGGLGSSRSALWVFLWILRSFSEQPEEVVRRCSVKKAFLKIWQNSQENICARVSFLIKLQILTAILHSTCERLALYCTIAFIAVWEGFQITRI